MIASRAGGIVVIWAFWLSPVDSPRQDSGWITAPMQETCETVRARVAEMAAQAGVRVRVSGCRQISLGELERRRHEPPDDLPPLVLTF